jgi:hypothetical protein
MERSLSRWEPKVQKLSGNGRPVINVEGNVNRKKYHVAAEVSLTDAAR